MNITAVRKFIAKNNKTTTGTSAGKKRDILATECKIKQ